MAVDVKVFFMVTVLVFGGIAIWDVSSSDNGCSVDEAIAGQAVADFKSVSKTYHKITTVEDDSGVEYEIYSQDALPEGLGEAIDKLLKQADDNDQKIAESGLGESATTPKETSSEGNSGTSSGSSGEGTEDGDSGDSDSGDSGTGGDSAPGGGDGGSETPSN